ncbi:hypothetical protein [Paenibacillus borealis]|uniref:hypothetical protein n=1 Tax=Paenibacillus borealis TaxID=160799 RepID=UPI001C54E6AD|nr:hypothetical protein [Paenibacillus borealis]
MSNKLSGSGMQPNGFAGGSDTVFRFLVHALLESLLTQPCTVLFYEKAVNLLQFKE